MPSSDIKIFLHLPKDHLARDLKYLLSETSEGITSAAADDYKFVNMFIYKKIYIVCK